ncbi:LpqB family beta-propeller domain-containing protein [Rothia sp. P5766]|uniref:LpqB family beta-propeller domain-containing protein n=1 Tax=Rothia sp. P5766 TaxID=3402656 RepID=UPI003AE796EA
MAKISRRTALSMTLSSLVASVSACATIPTDGEVNHYADPQATGSTAGTSAGPQGPQPGASPSEIIEGFLHAGTGVKDDYSVARQYLTKDLAQSWRPDGRTLVYNSSFTTRATGENSYVVAVPTSTEIDNRGLATSYTTFTDTEIEFSLEKVQQEWRISAVPDGTVLSRTEFGEVFNPFTLYFYDPTFTYAVPDIRWFAERSTIATSLIRVLLEGPAPYLEGAVVTAVPQETRLAINSVPVENGVADIQLAGGNALVTASALETERLRTQLTQALSNLATVASVQMSINNQVVAAQNLENYKEPTINAVVSGAVVGIENNRLVSRSALVDTASQQTIVEGVAYGAITQPAMNYTRNFYAYTNAGRNEIWLANSNRSGSIHRGNGILQPSFDHLNWLWLGEQGGRVRAYPAGQENGELLTVKTWLTEETVHSLAIARDGSRALVVTSVGGNDYAAWVSAIRRASDGTPQELMAPVRIGSDINPRGAEWHTDEEVFLWNTETTQTEIVSLSGHSTQYDPLQGIVRIVTGNGLDQAVAMTDENGLYIVAGRSWTRIETSLSEVNYSG